MVLDLDLVLDLFEVVQDHVQVFGCFVFGHAWAEARTHMKGSCICVTRFLQIGAAGPAELVSLFHEGPACGTLLSELAAALRAKQQLRFQLCLAARAFHQDRLAHNQVDDDSQQVWRKDGNECPQPLVHAAPAGIMINKKPYADDSGEKQHRHAGAEEEDSQDEQVPVMR